MVLKIPKEAGVRHIDLRGEHLDAPAGFDGDVLLICESRDCAQQDVTLDVASRGKFSLLLIEQRFGLPPFAAKLAAARPKTAIPVANRRRDDPGKRHRGACEIEGRRRRLTSKATLYRILYNRSAR